MNKQAETTCKRADRYIAPQAVPFCNSLQALPKEQINECRYADETGDTRIGERLQIFVMRLLDAKRAVPCVVFCKGHAERVKASSDDRMLKEYLKSYRPKMSAAIGNAALNLADANAAKQLIIAAEEQYDAKYCQHKRCRTCSAPR